MMHPEEQANLRLVHDLARVLSNDPLARDTYRLRLHLPTIAASILPGQFVMLRVPGQTDPLLARPFALYDVPHDSTSERLAFDIVYLVVGNGTRTLRRLRANDKVDVWGPLGNTFPVALPGGTEGHLAIVAGGIGQTPFPAVIAELLGEKRYGMRRITAAARRISFFWGVRSAEYFADLDAYRKPRVEVQLATDDGSAGRHGFATDLLETAMAAPDPPTAVFACGPVAMLARTASIVAAAGIPCWVSLETRMACGYGICFSCVCPIRLATAWDYRRVCIEGPVFPASSIAWREFCD